MSIHSTARITSSNGLLFVFIFHFLIPPEKKTSHSDWINKMAKCVPVGATFVPHRTEPGQTRGTGRVCAVQCQPAEGPKSGGLYAESPGCGTRSHWRHHPGRQEDLQPGKLPGVVRPVTVAGGKWDFEGENEWNSANVATCIKSPQLTARAAEPTFWRIKFQNDQTN